MANQIETSGVTSVTLNPLTFNGITFDKTVPYTVSEGTDVLVVRTAGDSTNFATFTYGGIALTLRKSTSISIPVKYHYYDLINPPTGNNDFYINSSGYNSNRTLFISQLKNVDKSDPIRDESETVGYMNFNGTPLANQTVNTEAGDLVLDIAALGSTITSVATSGQSVEESNKTVKPGYYASVSSLVATGQSTNISWGLTGANWGAHAAIVYKYLDTGGTGSVSEEYSSIARYLLSESSKGSGVSVAADDTGNGNNLSVNYGSSTASWSYGQAGNSFEIIGATGDPKLVSSNLDSSGSLKSELLGRKEFAVMLALSGLSPQSSSTYSSALKVVDSSGEDVPIYIGYKNTSNSKLSVKVVWAKSTSEKCEWTFEYTPLSTNSIILQIDTNKSSDGLSVWVDGIVESVVEVEYTQNLSPAVSGNNYRLYIGGNGSTELPLVGKYEYIELGSGVLSEQQITDAVANLSVNSDTDWEVVAGQPKYGASSISTTSTISTEGLVESTSIYYSDTDISASSNVVGIGAKGSSSDAVISASSNVVGIGAKGSSSDAVISASSGINVKASQSSSSDAAISASSNVVGIGDKGSSSDAAISASSNVVGVGQIKVASSAYISASSVISTSGRKNAYVSTTIAAEMSVSSDAIKVAYNQSEISCTSSIDGIGGKLNSAEALLNAGTNIVSTGYKKSSSGLVVSTTTNISVEGKKYLLKTGKVSIDSQNIVNTVGVKEAKAVANLTAGGSEESGAKKESQGYLDSVASQFINADGLKGQGNSEATIVSSASVIAIGRASKKSTASIGAAATIKPIGTRSGRGSLELSSRQHFSTTVHTGRLGAFSINSAANVQVMYFAGIPIRTIGRTSISGRIDRSHIKGVVARTNIIGRVT